MSERFLAGDVGEMQKYSDNDVHEVIMMIILSFYYIVEYHRDTHCICTKNHTKITVNTGCNVIM